MKPLKIPEIAYFIRNIQFKIIITFIFLQLESNICKTQNLVVNPGFEDTVSCPSEPGQINKCLSWKSYCNTPDYYNSCSGIDVGIPFNWQGKQNTLNGNAYVGLITYYWGSTDNTREIIGNELLTPLKVNHKYYVSMKVNMADHSGYATNNIGISFSTIPYSNHLGPMIHKNHTLFNESSIIKDSINWIKLKGTFIADSNYQYVMFGNFYIDSLTTIEHLGPNQTPYSYYYIDDVCVSEDSLTCHNMLGVNDIIKKTPIEVYPNPTNDILIVDTKNPNSKKITLYTINSIPIMQTSFTDSIILDLKTLSQGIYFYLIEDDTGFQYSGKLIKD